MERRFAGEHHGRTSDLAHGGSNGVRMPQCLAARGGEERHIRRNLQLGPIQNRLHRRLDILHPAVRMPADVDCLRLLGSFLPRE